MTASKKDSADIDRSIVELWDSRLTDSELVMYLLGRNDGKMSQKQITDLSPWSSSKVSCVLADMRADEKIIKVEYGPSHLVLVPADLPDILE